jgi:hypothetical protein
MTYRAGGRAGPPPSSRELQRSRLGRRLRRKRISALALLFSCFVAGTAAAQPQLVSPDQGRWRIGGFVEAQLRTLSDGFDADDWYLSQWAWVLNLEPELEIAPNGWGPFDSISAFARIEVRYECAFTGCGLSTSFKHFGDRARRAPARNWADGETLQSIGAIDLGELGRERERVHGDGLKLLPITENPGFQPFYDVGIEKKTVAEAFGPLMEDEFSWKSVPGPVESLAVPLGPWNVDSKIRPYGALAGEPSSTLPLPFRPKSGDLYTPTERLRDRLDDFDSFDQNFSESELAWNHGGSQDEYELKEVYLDLEMFDSRLWLRLGKQNIVWGKTELFRTTDQFNPVDIGLASLPSLEESRIALWSVRGVWSFYDLGPFDDVRLELAVLLDDFEPIDTGRCGEPYTVWPICLKSSALWAHGASGFGIAGEEHPPDPWDSSQGVEFGARLEWRWSRFSFALTDFYGYDDVPAIRLFNEYQRKVDPATGRPLDSLGRPLTPENALRFHPANRQGLDLGCKAAQGFGKNALIALTGGMGEIPDASERCILDILNLQEEIVLTAPELGGLSVTAAPTNAFGALLSGQIGGNFLLIAAQEGLVAAVVALFGTGLPQQLAPLNRDPDDGPSGGGAFGTDAELLPGLLGTSNLSYYLTDQQEALLGCGTFYLTDCDVDGVDAFNAEGSVLLQSFPGFKRNPVATRYQEGRLLILPGARGPADRGYDPRVDGCVDPGSDGKAPAGYCAGANQILIDGRVARSEMAALSANCVKTLAVLGIAEGDEQCDLDRPATCAAVRAVIALSGSQRPEVQAGGNGRFGRRDWTWHGGGEASIFYPKRNVLGFSFDVAEDLFKSSWGVEFTWIHDSTFASNTSSDLTQRADVYNLTVSVDRPTFINFLNSNRTFFLNSQVFFRVLPEHDSSFDTNGPLTVLATFTVATGYYQDRLLPATTFVHDFASASGGAIYQITYRFNDAFSATIGALAFYGGPERNRIPRHPIALFDTTTEFEMRTRYEGLSAISERDELFLRLRYTF